MAQETDRVWFRERLRSELKPYLEITDEQIGALYVHFALLLRWNQKMNLTSVRSAEEIVLRHYCECLYFASIIPEERTTVSLGDFGSGAGFPGVPIAVMRPGWRVLLIESHQRRSVFLRESTRHLSNVSVFAGRAEDVGRRFDWLVSRAVDPGEVAEVGARLADRLGLLIGKDDAARVHCAAIQEIPWGERRVACFT